MTLSSLAMARRAAKRSAKALDSRSGPGSSSITVLATSAITTRVVRVEALMAVPGGRRAVYLHLRPDCFHKWPLAPEIQELDAGRQGMARRRSRT